MPVPEQLVVVTNIIGSADTYIASDRIPFPFVITSLMMMVMSTDGTPDPRCDGAIGLRVSGVGDKNSVTYGVAVPVFAAWSSSADIRCVSPFRVPRMSYIWPDPGGYIFAHVRSLGGGTDICGIIAATIVDLNLYEEWLQEQAGLKRPGMV